MAFFAGVIGQRRFQIGGAWHDWDYMTEVLSTLRMAVKDADPNGLTTMNFHTDVPKALHDILFLKGDFFNLNLQPVSCGLCVACCLSLSLYLRARACMCVCVFLLVCRMSLFVCPSCDAVGTLCCILVNEILHRLLPGRGQGLGAVP